MKKEYPNFNPIGFVQIFNELSVMCPKSCGTRLQPAGKRVQRKINQKEIRIIQSYCEKCRLVFWKELK